MHYFFIFSLFFCLLQSFVVIEPQSIQIVNPADRSIANSNRQVTFKLFIDPKYTTYVENLPKGGTLKLLYFTRKEKWITPHSWKMTDEFYQRHLVNQEPWSVSIEGEPKFKFDFKEFRLQMKWVSPYNQGVVKHFQEFTFNFLDLASQLAPEQLQIQLDHERRKVIQNPFTVHELNQMRNGIHKVLLKHKRFDIELPKELPEKSFFGKKEVSNTQVYYFLSQLQDVMTAKPESEQGYMPNSQCVALGKIKKSLRAKRIGMILTSIGVYGVISGVFTALIIGFTMTGLLPVGLVLGFCFLGSSIAAANVFVNKPYLNGIHDLKSNQRYLLEGINHQAQLRGPY